MAIRTNPLPAPHTRGAREEINLVRMAKDLNRGHGGRNFADGNSIRHLELEITKALKAHPGNSVSLDYRVNWPDRASLDTVPRHMTPLSFDVHVQQAGIGTIFEDRVVNK